MSTASSMQHTGADPWTMEATSGGGGGDFEVCPAGNIPATVIGLFDIGYQDEDYNGERKEVRQVVVVYEMSKKQTTGQPFVMGQKFTWSLNAKASFRKMVESLTGTTFAESQKFDPRTLVGMPCMVQVAHDKKTKDGKERVYPKISAVAQFPDGLPAPSAVREPIVYSVVTGEPFPAGTEWLPFIYGANIRDLASAGRRTPRVGGFSAPASSAPPLPPDDGEDIPF
jgi:hypothetical protein